MAEDPKADAETAAEAEEPTQPFLYMPERPDAKLRLILFPYAEWHFNLAEEIELCCVSWPGKGPRMSEEPISSLSECVEYIVPHLKEVVADGKPYAVFGHSLGALLAFFVLAKMRDDGAPLPFLFIPSEEDAPTARLDGRKKEDQYGMLRNLKKPGWRKILSQFGVTEAVLNNDELLSLALPGIKVDFVMDQEFAWESSSKPAALPIPITFFGGQDGYELEEDWEGWEDLTTEDFNNVSWGGTHMYLATSECEIEVCEWLSENLPDLVD